MNATKNNTNDDIAKIIAQFCLKIEPFISSSVEGDPKRDIAKFVKLGISILQGEEVRPSIDMSDGLSYSLWNSIKDEQKRYEKANKFFTIFDYLKEVGKDDLIIDLLAEN